MNKLQRILESVDLVVYKKLLTILGDFITKFPATGTDNLFDQLANTGKKILPKDKKALEILNYVLDKESGPSSIQRLLNMRFEDLPADVKPNIKISNRYEAASWLRNGVVSDKIKDLVDWENTGKTGGWSDSKGNKAVIVESI